MKIKCISAAILVAVLCFRGSLLAYSGGTGEPNDPYKIANVADFNQLSIDPNNWDKSFILTADINLTSLTFTQASIAPDINDAEWGFQGTAFAGTFDGNGHVMSNLTITASTQDIIGLFGCVGEGGQIKNLGVENVNITGRNYVGGLVGYNYGGSVTSSYATGSVTGNLSVGGLVGEISWGELTSCYATDSVSGGSSVGGLLGDNYYYCTITSCYATGSVSGTGDYVGGLVGDVSSGSLAGCYATGSVNGVSYVGGLVGDNYYYGTLTACYATGSVTGTEDVGGLVGGNDSGTLNSCFWDIQTSGQSGSAGGKGLNTGQMKSMTICQNAGWADKGWVINDGLDYPRLAWENTAGVPIPQPQAVPLLGSGNEQDPYQIWTADDFAQLSWHVGILDKHIVLMTDLDLSDVVLYPIGDLGPFTGVFDGNDNIISNADINQLSSSYVGLFGYVGLGGQIRDLGIENVNIIGYYCVGGMVGYNYGGSVTACYATGLVTGTGDYVGGLLGENNDGTLTDCYASGSVSGTGYYVGGLVGYNLVVYNYDGSLTSCYATGLVTGTGDYVGGLLGENNDGTLTDCYASGSVSGTGYYVGGLMGWNEHGTLTACYATGSVTGTDKIGGLMGYNHGGSVTSCYATGAVSGTGSYVGGLLGDNDIDGRYRGHISYCYATGSVTGGNWYVGGLVGSNYGSLTACYATGSVNGTGYSVGGLVGEDSGSLTSCYATGSVTGNCYVGGLVGWRSSFGTITGCYATGAVSGNSWVGGLVGWNFSGSITACFWDIQTSGQSIGVGSGTSTGVTGKSTADMMTLSTFTSPPASWDFSATDGDPADWMMLRPGEDYPRLAWQEVFAGDIAGLYGVTFVDYAEIAAHWGQRGCPTGCENADINNDGIVDSNDLMFLADNWLAGI